MSWSICIVLFAATLTAYACCVISGRQDDLERHLRPEDTPDGNRIG